MFGQKEMILTAGTCSLLENLRLILEVLYGSRIRFRHIHLEKGLRTGCFSIYVEDKEIKLTFTCRSDQRFDIWTEKDMYYARLDNPTTVRVINIDCKDSYPGMWIVGTSHDNRHEESLF